MSATHALMEKMDVSMRAMTLIRSALPNEPVDQGLYSEAITLSGIVEELLARLHEEMLPQVVAQVYVMMATGMTVSEDDTVKLTRIVADTFRKTEAAKRLATAA